ncbi:interactor of HORMAD1 protein 1 [Varanus komodoensis]|uniref:interactor of HORMAD1 protein 1 n=1 Tax=Varanus komodoensis TaxID=61221 RepID=UPI001CF79554|nr:interactor of HORMAD1 protein 1 [Varanus komodoensis]
MNMNLSSIKDMFSTPTKMGPNKPSSWTSVPSDCNSLSDSQFLFGSQFCPENSQSASAPLEFSIQQRQGKSSQQNSQDVSWMSKASLLELYNLCRFTRQNACSSYVDHSKSDPAGPQCLGHWIIEAIKLAYQLNESSIFAKYQSKPQLFGGDGKEKGSLNFPAGRFKGVLEQFEENKKKIKEKYDNEVLNTFILNTKESLQRETVQSHYGLVLNALRDRNEMEQTLLGMGKSLQDKDTEISALKSSLQLLRESLDQLTVQQNEQHLKLCEQLGYMQLPSLLSEFQTFISAPRVLSHLKDRESQTSPNMLLTQLPSSPHLSLLNIPAGSKVIATISSTPDKENVGTPQRSHIIAGCPDADNVLCTLFANEAAGSHEACWLLTQEPCQATPVRKVIKRDKQVKGRNAVRLSQLNWAHKDSMFMQKHSGDQMNEKLGTDRKKQMSPHEPEVAQSSPPPWLISQSAGTGN